MLKKELQDKLFDRYPKLFRHMTLSSKETTTCRGIECPDEWYHIIDTLCYHIQSYAGLRDERQVEVVQVKSKFGELRFYADYEEDDGYITGLIRMAVSMSKNVPMRKFPNTCDDNAYNDWDVTPQGEMK